MEKTHVARPVEVVAKRVISDGKTVGGIDLWRITEKGRTYEVR